MSKRSCIFLTFAIIAASILLNIFIFGKLSCTGEYIHGTDIFGNEQLERRDIVLPADRILSGCDTDDYPELRERLISEKNEIKEYITAYEYKNSGFDMLTYQNAMFYSRSGRRDWADNVLGRTELSYEQAKLRYEQLKYCISRLDYALSYTDYTAYISKNSDNMLTISLLDENSFHAKNAIKAKRDFYGLGSVRPSADSDIGIISLFSDSPTDIIAVICAVCAAAVIGAYLTKQTFFKRSGLLLGGLAVLGGIAVMYLCNAVLTEKYVGMGSILRPIQSVQSFMTSSIIMNIGTLTAVRILFKAAACVCVFFVVSGIIAASKKVVPICISAVFILTELITANSDNILGSANIFNAFRPERLFGVYGNLNILGNAVSPLPIFVITMILILAISAVFAMRCASSRVLAAREAAEREYFDEIGRKYEETRKIRHDINNHLAVLGILINEGKTEEAKAYLGEISEEISSQKPPAATGRPVLDALLLSKARLAKDCGICFNICVDTAFSEDISDYDLCGIFGNILDNAIEACGKTEGEKYIWLTVKKQMDMLCIFCENPYSGSALSPTLETDKDDKAAHGFGIKRIEQLAAKHGGLVKISAENGVFSISILIQN